MLTGFFPTVGGVRLPYAFSGRAGGASAEPYASRNLGDHVGDDETVVLANRASTARELGLSPDHLVFMEQVHSDVVRVVDGPTTETVPHCDGLVTARPGLGLAVMVADCVPILLADPAAGVVGAVHAGRRGVGSGIVMRAVAEMVGLGASTASISVRLGPSICGSCYEVPQDIHDEIVAVAPDSSTVTAAGTPGLDLRRGLAGVLRSAGITDVETVGPCTRESEDFYSYRGAEGAPTGRFAGFVVVPDEASS